MLSSPVHEFIEEIPEKGLSRSKGRIHSGEPQGKREKDGGKRRCKGKEGKRKAGGNLLQWFNGTDASDQTTQPSSS